MCSHLLLLDLLAYSPERQIVQGCAGFLSVPDSAKRTPSQNNSSCFFQYSGEQKWTRARNRRYTSIPHVCVLLVGCAFSVCDKPGYLFRTAPPFSTTLIGRSLRLCAPLVVCTQPHRIVSLLYLLRALRLSLRARCQWFDHLMIGPLRLLTYRSIVPAEALCPNMNLTIISLTALCAVYSGEDAADEPPGWMLPGRQ